VEIVGSVPLGESLPIVLQLVHHLGLQLSEVVTVNVGGYSQQWLEGAQYIVLDTEQPGSAYFLRQRFKK
jgi:hypothetical protein